MRKRLRCFLAGHDWESGLPSRHSWCRRCQRYDDDPRIVRAYKVMGFARRWSPLWITVTRRDLTIVVGYTRPEANVHLRLHYGWERQGELPGLNLSLTLWRLRLSSGIGQGWQDEDGEDRGLLYAQARFQTYGLRYVGCWFGHKPTTSKYMAGHVYCDRCDVSLETAKPEQVAA